VYTVKDVCRERFSDLRGLRYKYNTSVPILADSGRYRNLEQDYLNS